MKWARARVGNDDPVYGIVEDGKFEPVTGSPFADWSKTGVSHPLSDVALDVPVIPPTFYAIGLNYAGHAREIAEAQGTELVLPKQPDAGYRANNALIADEETIVIPPDAGPRVHYEGEIVVVIGRKARHVSEEDALSYVFGYTVGNDVSERDWQKGDRTFWRSKNTDTWKPMGPFIETDVNLDGLTTVVRVNGVETSRFKTNDMVFGIETFIATLTRNVTLYPGDVIWMGTDGYSPDLQDGDVVEVEIDGIGLLRNPVRRERA